MNIQEVMETGRKHLLDDEREQNEQEHEIIYSATEQEQNKRDHDTIYSTTERDQNGHVGNINLLQRTWYVRNFFADPNLVQSSPAKIAYKYKF